MSSIGENSLLITLNSEPLKYLLKTFVKTLFNLIYKNLFVLQSFLPFCFLIVFYLLNTDGKTTTTGRTQVQLALVGQDTFREGICLRILVPAGILGISIYRSYVFLSRFQEVERQLGGMSVFVGCTTYIPVASSFGTTGNGNVVARFCFLILGFVPVDGHVLDELEGIHEAVVVFRNAGSHLKRTIHSDIQSQLANQCRTYA